MIVNDISKQTVEKHFKPSFALFVMMKCTKV